jgi:hypothetical protein
MSPEELQFPAAYCDGKAYFLEPTNAFSWTHFGGPGEMFFEGLDVETQYLHHILNLHAGVVPPLERQPTGPAVPLFYGMQHEGCGLSYRMTKPSVCEMIELQPSEGDADYPYPDYPRLLPYIPMRLAKSFDCSARQFAELAWQGVDIKPNTMAVIVPPLFVGGVSMWGKWGDGEGVQIIFEYDLQNQTIRASNQCT